MSAIDQAIAEAQAAAANYQAPAPVETNAGTGTAVSSYNTQAGAPLSAEDMLSGSLDVAAWLKVSKFGMNIDADTTMFETIEVELDMSTVQYCYSVRYGNPAKYEKTYDHQVDVKGRPWVQVLQHAQRVDPKAAEFRSADVPFVALQTLVNKKGDVLVSEGDAMGHSISITGWKLFQRFMREMVKAGIDINKGIVHAKLVHEYQKNDKGEWGILKFENIRAA